MALNDRFNKLFGLDDEQGQPDTDFNQRTDVDDKVTAMDNDNISDSKSQIALFEPRIFSDAKEAAKQLIAGQAVILNFERIDDE